MANTYTSDWFSVSNGDVTTHNPQTLAPTDKDIRILGSEIRWEGVDDTKSTRDTATNTNTGSATATTSTEEKKNTNSDTLNFGGSAQNGQSLSGSESTTVNFPYDDGGFVRHEMDITANSDAEVYLDVTWDNINGFENTSSNSFAGTWVIEDESGTTSYQGQPRDLSFDWEWTNNTGGESSVSGSVTISVDTYYDAEVVNSDTTYVDYPSVPSGYDFDYHYWREDKNGDFVESDFVYSNKVGESRSVTSNDPGNTWELTMKTHGEDTNYYTASTEDPRVTRDVGADSGSVTLSDGEVSSWYQLDGLAADEEEFYHDISGSNKARFQFRFDWEEKFPDAIKQLRVYDEDAGVTRLVALADPSDSELLFSSIRTYENGAGQVLVVDVTDDPSGPNSISSHRIYHPTHGELYLRYYDTV